MEEYCDVDEHSHTYEEIWDEERIADKLYAVHQRRDTRDITVENQSGEERSEDTFIPQNSDMAAQRKSTERM